jgi:hypothetical protein
LRFASGSAPSLRSGLRFTSSPPGHPGLRVGLSRQVGIGLALPEPLRDDGSGQHRALARPSVRIGATPYAFLHYSSAVISSISSSITPQGLWAIHLDFHQLFSSPITEARQVDRKSDLVCLRQGFARRVTRSPGQLPNRLRCGDMAVSCLLLFGRQKK